MRLKIIRMTSAGSPVRQRSYVGILAERERHGGRSNDPRKGFLARSHPDARSWRNFSALERDIVRIKDSRTITLLPVLLDHVAQKTCALSEGSGHWTPNLAKPKSR